MKKQIILLLLSATIASAEIIKTINPDGTVSFRSTESTPAPKSQKPNVVKSESGYSQAHDLALSDIKKHQRIIGATWESRSTIMVGVDPKENIDKIIFGVCKLIEIYDVKEKTLIVHVVDANKYIYRKDIVTLDRSVCR